MFYLERARKSKTAAKILIKLKDINLEDIPTLIKMDEILAKYRAYRQHEYQLSYLEQQLNQYDLYLKYASNYPERAAEVKQKIIDLSEKMTKCHDQVEELDKALYSAGKGRALAQLLEDAPPLRDPTPEEKQAEAERQQIEAEAAAAAAAAAAQKAAKASKGKEKAAPVAPAPVVIKEEPPAETEEQIAARREKKRQALAPVVADNSQLQHQLRKAQNLKAALSTHAALLPAAPPRRDPNSTSILRPADQQYEFFFELQEELHERGLDRLPRPYMVYRRLDMYKIIFKLANVEAIMKQQ